MPELPDVEIFNRYLRNTSLHKPVSSVDIEETGILGETGSRSFKLQVSGRIMEDTRRHGKYLFVKLDNGKWLEFHFGMTGSFVYFEVEKYAQMLYNFKDGTHLAYISKRKLGSVDIAESPESVIQEKKLGPDAFGIDSFADFASILDGRRGHIKARLMDQQLIAGIGNVYADEILFDCGLHPKSKVEKCSEQQLKKLFRSITDILQKAIEKDADPEQMGRSFLLPRRSEGKACGRCSGTIKKIDVSGRSAYYCGKHQKKIA